jgi:two-component system, NarL family, sensor histidine kinase DesK
MQTERHRWGWRSRGLSPRLLPFVWVVWLPALAQPLAAFFTSRPSPVRATLTLLGAAAFVALYLWAAWHNRLTLEVRLMGRRIRPWYPIPFLAALSILLSLGNGGNWLGLFIYTSAITGGCLAAPYALAVVAVLAPVTLLTSLASHTNAADTGNAVGLVVAVGLTTLLVMRGEVLNRQLKAAREEIVRLAVNEERLRFARDLHDLLGHSLSLIALKSELAGKLAEHSPERAAAEIRDVEAAARSALQDVRAAVAGYRQPALATELEGVKAILTAAGIDYLCTGALPDVRAPVEAALAWAVREGVTNVIRHSRATCCTVTLGERDGCAILSVEDDGQGTLDIPASTGSGLPGLAERLATVGGTLNSTRLPGGGFRLTVAVPLTASDTVFLDGQQSAENRVAGT